MTNWQVHRNGVLAVTDRLLSIGNIDVHLRGRAGTKTCRITVNCIPVHIFASNQARTAPFMLKNRRGLENQDGISIFVKLKTNDFYILPTIEVPVQSNGIDVLIHNLEPFKDNWKLIEERSK